MYVFVQKWFINKLVNLNPTAWYMQFVCFIRVESGALYYIYIVQSKWGFVSWYEKNTHTQIHENNNNNNASKFDVETTHTNEKYKTRQKIK